MSSIARLKTSLQEQLGLNEWGERVFIPGSIDDEIIETNQQFGVGSIDASKIKNLSVNTIDVSTSGYIKSGKTSFTDSTNAGWYLSSQGVYIGSAGDVTKFLYNVATGALTITGSISATTGSIGGFDIGSNYIRDVANSFGLSSSVDTVTSTISSRAVSLNGTTGLTMIQNANADDANIQVDLPFTVYFNGASYTSVFVSSNGYLTFGSGSSTFTSLSGSNPPIPGIHINAADRSYQRVYKGSVDGNATYIVRYEGSSTTSGTPGSSTVIWEVKFDSAYPNQFKIDIGSNAASGTGTSGVTSGAAYLYTFASGTVNIGYTFGFANNVRFWAGSTFANRSVAPARIDASGSAAFTNISLTGNVILSGLQAGSSINGTYLQTASITGAKIANATITATNITAATITATEIANATITAAKIANATITATQIANATITGTNIASGTITSTNIQDATITGTDIASGTITGGNIAAATIAASNIVDATITGGKIATATITGGKIATATITGGNIAAGTITSGNIQDATITGSDIAAATIAASNIVDATITASKIANATITASQIANATITGTQIANGTITGTNIAAATIAASNIISGTITTTQIASGTIVASNIAASTITGTQIASGTITATNITALTITATEIANLTINGAKIAASAVSPDKTNVPVFIMTGTFTNNSPSAGRVAWSSAIVYYNGTAYTITDNNTSSRYIVWDSTAPTELSGSSSVPTVSTSWLVGMNNSGTFLKTWDMPQIHGEQIQSATITGSQIASATISATNIQAATITASQIANATITTTQISNSAGITGTQIAAQTITASNIQNATITSSQIASATIAGSNIAAGTITSGNIQDATITGSDIASGTITATNIQNATITGTQISATAGITGSQLANNTITATQIANGTITSSQISGTAGITGSQMANNTVTATQIANGTITTSQISGTAGITGSQIANNTITASNITSATLTATQLSDGAVTAKKTTLPLFVLSAGTFTNNSPIAGKVAWSGAKVVYNGTEYTITDSNTSNAYIIWDSGSPTTLVGIPSVPTTAGKFLVGINASGTYSSVWDVEQVNGLQIQANSITAGQIANATITTTQISGSAGITGSQLANNTITATQIQNATITTTQLSGTAGITGGQIANNTISASNIVNATITSTQIANATITATQIADATITGGKIASGTITATNIASATITANEITNLTITANKIADLAITNAKINDLSVSKLTAGTITSKSIVLDVADGTGDVEIRSGIASGDFANAGAANGFILGVDDSDSNKAKFYFGNSTSNINWNGTTLAVNGGTIDGTGTFNGSLNSTVQDRAEADYLYGLFRGWYNDGMQINSSWGGEFSRSILVSNLPIGHQSSSLNFYSGNLGYGYFGNNQQFFIRAILPTEARNSNTTGSNTFLGTMEHNTTNISPTNSSTAVYPNFYLSNKEYYGFAQVGNGSNSLYAVSSDALGRQDKTLVNGVTTTNFNNYKVIFTAGSLPSISNTGQIRATSITNGASPFTNSANIIDADANTYGYATYSYLKEIGLSWDGGTSWTGLTNIGSYSATKVTTVFANDKNTWWRSWSPSDFSNSNFVLRFTEMDGGGHNNKIANSIASDHHFDLKNFNFNTSGWVDITGIKVEVINETEDIGGPKVLIYDVLVTVYYTTAHGTGNIKYYVNDNLVATHYVAIPSSAGTGLFLEHNYSQGGGTTTSGSGEFKFFNNYKLRFDS